MGQQRVRQMAGLKAQVAVGALKRQQTLTVLATSYGRRPVQVAQWKKQALSGFPELFAWWRAGVQDDAEARQAQLYEESGRLKVEWDWLKRKNYRVSRAEAGADRAGP